MIRSALILAALSLSAWVLHPAPALPDTSDVTLTAPQEDDGSIAWIVHTNQVTDRGEYAIAIHVDGYGVITGVLTVAPGTAPDTLTILDVPEGLAVIPPGVTTAEGDRSVLKVFPAVGF